MIGSQERLFALQHLDWEESVPRIYAIIAKKDKDYWQTAIGPLCVGERVSFFKIKDSRAREVVRFQLQTSSSIVKKFQDLTGILLARSVNTIDY